MKPAEAVRENPVPLLPPKPRKGVFVILCIAFALWIGVLAALYARTSRVKPLNF
jgi:hypothetical protein